jgi:hypothetical protein
VPRVPRWRDDVRQCGTASFGRIGEYRRRVYWNRWGVLEDAVFEVTCSEPVPLRIVDAFLNPTQQEAA